MENTIRNTEIEMDSSMEETEEDGIAKEVDFSSAVVWGTDWTTETIAMQIAKGNIDLNPNFQRRDAWSNKEKSKLIESLMLGIPVPPIVLAESPNIRNHYIVIDGKQRLLSIMQFYADNKTIIDDSNDDKYDKLSLTGLEVLKDLNRKTYSKIPSNYISNIDNGTIRTIAIKNWPDENFLYTVFLRLNTGSKKLSPQELRQALKPGEFLKYLDDASANSASIRKMLKNNNPDKRMRDVELSLRYFGFKYFINEYKGNLREFLDFTCQKLNEEWSNIKDEIKLNFYDLEKSIDFAFELFPDYPFGRFNKKESSKSFNRCIFELFTYFFSNEDIRLLVSENKNSFINEFYSLNDNIDFIQSIEQYPKATEKVVTRFNMFYNLLKKIDNKSLLTKECIFKFTDNCIEVI